MYNSKDIADRIKVRAKQLGKPLGEVLSSCELGINTISKMSKGADIYTRNFARIADCLNCSVDYLLGRASDAEIKNVANTPTNDSETDMLTMYRLLTDADKEEIFMLIRLKYARAQGERTESLYSTYTAASGILETDHETA